MIVDRLLQIIEYKGINKSKFYKQTGLSNGFLDKVKDVGVSKIEVILNTYPEISAIWLLKGEGSMLKSDIEKPPEINMNNYLVDVQKKLIEHLEQENERLKKQIKRNNGYQSVAEPND